MLGEIRNEVSEFERVALLGEERYHRFVALHIGCDLWVVGEVEGNEQNVFLDALIYCI